MEIGNRIIRSLFVLIFLGCNPPERELNVIFPISGEIIDFKNVKFEWETKGDYIHDFRLTALDHDKSVLRKNTDTSTFEKFHIVDQLNPGGKYNLEIQGIDEVVNVNFVTNDVLDDLENEYEIDLRFSSWGLNIPFDTTYNETVNLLRIENGMKLDFIRDNLDTEVHFRRHLGDTTVFYVDDLTLTGSNVNGRSMSVNFVDRILRFHFKAGGSQGGTTYTGEVEY